MGIDIGGNTIVRIPASGVSLNTLAFNSIGQGSASPAPGYTGWKAGTTYYAAPTGWETTATHWQSGLNVANGIFTCPVAGYYAMGYNSIHNGGQGYPTGYNTYGYSAFAKNGALDYYVHWNWPIGGWNTGGTAALFSCAAGDTLTLLVNRSPLSAGPDSISQNMGMYPNTHHAVWCKLVG